MKPTINLRFLTLSFAVILCLNKAIGNEVFIRYNHLGYLPQAKKEVIVFSNSDLKGVTWQILDSLSDNVHSGSFQGSITGKSIHTSHDFYYKIDFSQIKNEGSYTLKVAENNSIQFKIQEGLYAFIPSEILRYFRVMRSGSVETLDHKPGHFGDSSCVVFKKKSASNESWAKAEETKKLNMLGGWYDAGDYLKFTLTNAYATHRLLHAYSLNPEFFQFKKYSKSDFPDVLDEAKWGLQYLLKTMQDTNEFVIQVGGAEDHKYGNRLPQNDQLDGKRQCYSDFSITQMGYSSAALALGAKVFKELSDTVFAKNCEREAIKIYQKAKNLENVSWVQQGWEIFYSDKKGVDNMQLAATELYKLTGSSDYLKDAKFFARTAREGWWVSWGEMNLTAHNRLLPDYQYADMFIKNELSEFKKIAKMPENVWGVPHEYTWGTLYSFFGVANGAMLYDLNNQNKEYSSVYFDVLDYTLGRNNWGIAFVASKNIPNSIRNVYSQFYKLQRDLFPIGAVAEGPGDRKTHLEVKQYFKIPADNSFDQFNTEGVVFYDNETNFQTMETTIGGLADALLFFTLINSI
jgi:hypothetical protein